MHHKVAIAMFEPTPPVQLVHNSDAMEARAKELTTDLRTVTGDIRTLRQLLESTLNEAQLEVYRDIEAKQMLRDRLTTDLDLQIRQLARRLQGRSRG
jgi:hypothetical protein